MCLCVVAIVATRLHRIGISLPTCGRQVCYICVSIGLLGERPLRKNKTVRASAQSRQYLTRQTRA